MICDDLLGHGGEKDSMKETTTRIRVGEASLEVQACLSDVANKGHDRYLVRSGFMGVADGATPLEPHWPQDVGEFADAALSSLSQRAGNPASTLRDIWRGAVLDVLKIYGPTEPKLSTGVAIARAVGPELEVSTIGDCEILVELDSEVVNHIRDPRLRNLDALAAAKPSVEEERFQLLSTRSSMNSENGYWIFAGNPEVANHIVSARYPIRNVSALLLYTDGFYRLVEPLGLVASPSQLVGLTRRLGAVEAMNLLRKHEGNVPSRKGGSAFGSPDDATALYAAPTPSQL